MDVTHDRGEPGFRLLEGPASRAAFSCISRAEAATPSAFAAFPGPRRTEFVGAVALVTIVVGSDIQSTERSRDVGGARVAGRTRLDQPSNDPRDMPSVGDSSIH